METYCISCKKNTKTLQALEKNKEKRLMLLSNFSICGKKKSMLIKNKELHQAFALIKLKQNH